MNDYTALASGFRRFAQHECGPSPLYKGLANAIAADEAVLEVAAQARSRPVPNLLLAAVHYLLLAGNNHELRRFYPSLGGHPTEGAYPVFREFVLAHRDEIIPLLHSRRVQTNEVARASVLLPALGLIATRTNGTPLALIEVGTSAGMLLLFDRFAYDYGDGVVCGNAGSPVRLRCETRGAIKPPVPRQMPAVVSRVGIDLFPIDVSDPHAAMWLRALVWPDQTERFERLTRAIDLAKADPPALVAGDAFAAAPAALEQVGDSAVPVVFHCHTLNQFQPEDRERFIAMLAQASTGRTLYHLALEFASAGDEWPEMWLRTYRDGALLSLERLAKYQAHGDWVEWSLHPGSELVY